MKKLCLVGAVCLSYWVSAQQVKAEKDSLEQHIALEQVLVSAVRAKETLPVTFSNLNQEQIKKNNAGQQIPMLLNLLPNVISYSEDGTGFGATYLSVRGSDSYRTNVTINGIAYNDSESQGTFWYNLSDFASSAQSIQLQRGIGTSTNGAGAFGASLNILTDAISEKAYAEIGNFYGSYNTHRHSVKLSTGKINNRVEFLGRFSKIDTDGYRDRSSSDLQSYFLQGAYQYGSTLVKALVFGGKEKTQLTYIGVDAQTLNENRRYNPSGAYQDAENKTQYYDNQTDNYKQDHAQLHWVERWTTRWTTNLALHYTKGKGYWEMYETWAGDGKHQINRYGLDNDFYGLTLTTNYIHKKLNLTFSGAYNQYDGLHYDQNVWSQQSIVYQEITGQDKGYKKDGSAFIKASWQITPKWNLFGDLQYRYVNYKADKYLAQGNFNFINPKVGINYSLNRVNELYFSYGQASREPNRSDYKSSYKAYKKLIKKDAGAVLKEIKPEKLHDFELGWRYNVPSIKINTNLYYMKYKDQLVLTGQLNDRGYPIRDNSGNSYRAGAEIDATVSFSKKWIWQPNVSFSKNKNIDFHFENDKKEIINLGNTHISFSPEWVLSNSLTFFPIENFQTSLISKFVSSQYMSNTNAEDSKINPYFVTNLNLLYQIHLRKIFKTITFSAMFNNIFNAKYVAYGTYEKGNVAYFPQAEANFLTGVTLSF